MTPETVPRSKSAVDLLLSPKFLIFEAAGCLESPASALGLVNLIKLVLSSSDHGLCALPRKTSSLMASITVWSNFMQP